MSKVRKLYIQLEPMQRLASQLKTDRQSAMDKVAALQTEMADIVHRVQVRITLGVNESL